VPARAAFALLALARLASASFNIIHDCDETFNYLEPLHYFLHGSGMQTWEYSSQFALRSWLYLLLHAPVAGAPALLGLGAGRGELRGQQGCSRQLNVCCIAPHGRSCTLSTNVSALPLSQTKAWCFDLDISSSASAPPCSQAAWLFHVEGGTGSCVCSD
jgi:hypothetical protein